jgi:hypothetical protein
MVLCNFHLKIDLYPDDYVSSCGTKDKRINLDIYQTNNSSFFIRSRLNISFK